MKIYTTVCTMQDCDPAQFISQFSLEEAKKVCQIAQGDIECKQFSQSTKIQWEQDGPFYNSSNDDKLGVTYEIAEWEVEFPV